MGHRDVRGVRGSRGTTRGSRGVRGFSKVSQGVKNGVGGVPGIRDLMRFSDLENLLSIGRIFYQLGESYLNLFLLHKVENL